MRPEVSELEKIEQQSFEEDDTGQLPPADVVAYNELRSCADLFRMYRDGILKIQPEYQREIVWLNPAQTRFIDSLVKQLPIPSMCFSLDYRSQSWQVIDGLQRMHTIVRFLGGSGWTLSKLDDIDTKLSGQPVAAFANRKSELHSYYRRVENLTLPVTVLRCDYRKKSHMNYIFTIFHRLNSGGAKLNNQEIRNCIYSGGFNDLLKELDGDPDWMGINRMEQSGGHRYTKQELILRFFAFHDTYESYRGRLARFLNDYMDEHRYPPEDFIGEKRDLFKRTVAIVYRYIYQGVVPPRLSITVLEAALVGVSRNLADLEAQPDVIIRERYNKLIHDRQFSEESLKEGLAGREKVIGRLATAVSIFSGD